MRQCKHGLSTWEMEREDSGVESQSWAPGEACLSVHLLLTNASHDLAVLYHFLPSAPAADWNTLIFTRQSQENLAETAQVPGKTTE